MSMPERVLWSRLRGGRCYGIKFRRQHPMGEFVADFFCRDAALIVEVDGMTHVERTNHDQRRDAWMRERGVETLRIPVSAISRDADRVIEHILRVVERRMEELKPGQFAHRKETFLRARAVEFEKMREAAQNRPARDMT